jgi:Asp-tRNA(Asn)/Glu-tRNA(Gln) amidotransferase A subunit family amidase
VPLGKTNAPELGTTPWTEPDLFGPCRNPWDPGRTPGGSSGGAAAALAAGLCPASNGSDGGGSIRIPAAACGVFGLKPTRDRISNGPLLGSFGFELSTRGPITRTVTDAALLLGVMAGAEPGDPGLLPEPARPWTDEVGADPGRLRVGIFAASPFGHLAPPVDPEDAWAFAKDLVGATPMVNATGQPAAAIPIHWDPETGLPVGVQLVGRFADEATVLRVAAQLEAARPWADRRPAAYA